MTPRVVLLILTWNRRDDVLRCLASLGRLVYENYVAVLIDNASADGTVEVVKLRYPHLVTLQNPRNLGYAGGNNAGIRWALEHGADYVLILNMDTEVTPSLITQLVEVAEQDDRIAVVGCRNLQMDDSTRLWGAYGRLTYGPFVVRSEGAGCLDGPFWQTVKDVDSVIGNGYLWRRAAIESVGLLDESFFAYHEDLDWCLRARRAGYRVVYAGTAAIFHKGTACTEGARSGPRWYLLGRNGVHFVRKHGRVSEKVRFIVSCGAALAFRLARSAVHRLRIDDPDSRRRGAAEWDVQIKYVEGIVDALRHRPIPFERLGLATFPIPREQGAPARQEK
jgi:hypothetical protein